MYSERISLVFKRLQVVRMVDIRNTLIYSRIRTRSSKALRKQRHRRPSASAMIPVK
jgi:catabolite regulation protein CreA